MSYNNNLVKRRLDDPAVSRDHQDASEENGMLGKLLIASAIAYGGYKAYESGALKPLLKSLLEYGDDVAKHGGDDAANQLHALKKWANLRRYEGKAEFTMSKTQFYNPPKHSLFRTSKIGLIKNELKDLKDSFETGHRLFHHRRIIDDTADDIKLFLKMRKEERDLAKEAVKNYGDIEILRNINDTNRAMMTAAMYAPDHIKEYQDLAMQAFRKHHTLSKKEMEAQMKRTGYRTMVLGDVLEVENNHLRLKASAKIDLNDQSHTLQRLQYFLERNEYRDKELRRTFVRDWDVAKNFILDPSIRIDEVGNVIDYRMSKKTVNRFQRSLTRDFGLPVVQFNPLSLVTNWANAGDHTPYIGLLNHKQVDAVLTGRAGNITIGEALGKAFGEKYQQQNVFVVDGAAYIGDLERGGIQKIADGLNLNQITTGSKFATISSRLNAQRKMTGNSLGEVHHYTPEEFNKLTNSQKLRYRLGEKLGLGWQERTVSYENDQYKFDRDFNLDEFMDKIINKVSEQKFFRTNAFEVDDMEHRFEFENSFKSVFGESFEKFKTVHGREFTPDMFVTSKKSFTFKSVWNAKDSEERSKNFKKYIKQFFAGQKKDGVIDENFTEASTRLYRLFDSLSEHLGGSSYLLGLPLKDKKSAGDIVKNFALKRFLPFFVLTQIPGMIDLMSEPIFSHFDTEEDKENGTHQNLSKFMMGHVVKRIDLAGHRLKDLTGITTLMKKFDEFTPGSEQLFELPGVYQLGLTQTTEERKEYIENGNDPVRKGRYWSAGNTPFIGGKILYFRPNAYRRVQADVAFSDSKWGSRSEYYNNTWFPNPFNPLAPLNHFILDPHHYDYVHYKDRPYLQTGAAGQNLPLIGPLVGSVTRLFSKEMHREDWERGLVIDPSDELPSPLLSHGTMDVGAIATATQTNTFDNSKKYIQTGNQTDSAARTSALKTVSSIMARGSIQPSNTAATSFSNTMRSYDKYHTNFETYTTPSGNTTVVDVPDNLNLYNVNQSLKHQSISHILGTEQRVSASEIRDNRTPILPVGNDSVSIDNSFLYGVGEQYNLMTDVFGLRGFGLRTITGKLNDNSKQLDTSSYAYSFNRSFWDENLGGLGGGLSEISRRFINRRNSDTEFINPIRNTQPSWMPGSDYYTDFKHGDPYTKVPHGEERLVGEGYERLHGIHDLMKLNIGSSFLGYGKERMVQHFLKQDEITDTFGKDTVNRGTKIHHEIENRWKDTGIAIDTEAKVEDKKNGILGYYDAMIVDPSSKTGVSIVDIKSTSAKKIDEIRKAKEPLEHHKKQVNYYLWATGNTKSKGYIYYVDKENLDNNYTIGFNYDPKLLKETLQDLKDARAEVRKGLENGTISRGDLYKDIDRFRILADVAPYSNEFKDMKTKLSDSMELSQKEQKEIQTINEQVKQQKQQLNVHPYKFKTSNLSFETVTVAKVIDNNTFTTYEYGKEHAIKLAGINVSQSNTEKWNDTEISMNDRASMELRRYIKSGKRVTISYDADPRKKYNKDSTESILAVVHSGRVNVNRHMLKTKLASEKDDDRPAAIHARYSNGEIAFGSFMEKLTHGLRNVPIIGNKILQVSSPYEQYRKREVYSKDFQSWEHPIKDFLVPTLDDLISQKRGILVGAFVGSMFGKTPFGKMVGTAIGSGTIAIGQLYAAIRRDKEKDWIPKRRRKQEELNEYVDVLRYIKNMKLYSQYKQKAKLEDHFDVDSYLRGKKSKGYQNKSRQYELDDYKRKVKLDYKHRKKMERQIKPKYTKGAESKKETIAAINKEMAELQSERKVMKIPANAMKALTYYQQAKETMYGYNKGDSIQNVMKALPKKERLYFKYFMDAPEEERNKILRIAPSYLRRALQASWGLPVDAKPTLSEYFTKHALPDQNWAGWQENIDMESVKVKLIKKNNLDPGEFDIWKDQKVAADKVNIPIPNMDLHHRPEIVQIRLMDILHKQGYDEVRAMNAGVSMGNEDSADVTLYEDQRPYVKKKIQKMQI